MKSYVGTLGALALAAAIVIGNGAQAAGTAAGAAVAPAKGATANPAKGAAATPLDGYLENLKTLRATFLQTLADAHGREIDRATGTLIVSRPGKFSWEIHPQSGGGSSGAAGQDGNSTAGQGGAAAGADAGAASKASGSGAAGTSSGAGGSNGGGSSGQLMVADGRNLWFFDRDLEQVTVKPVDAALSATPAMLLSGTVDLRKNFTITPAGQRDGLEWVLVEPRGTEADFRNALFGFAGDDLKRMILEDKLGQTATIIFQHVERNGPISPQEVSFSPPAGADVIGTPRK